MTDLPRESAHHRAWILVALKWAVAVPGLLILVLGVGIAARYLTGKARLDRLKAVHAHLDFEPVVPQFIRNRIGDTRCLPLDQIQSIWITEITDEQTSALRGCHGVKRIDIRAGEQRRHLTDAGLAHLHGLTGVRQLVIRQCDFGPTGMEAIARCPDLEELSLETVTVTDSSLEPVRRIPKLRYFSMYAADLSQVTARGIEAIASAPELRKVYLQLPANGDSAFEALAHGRRLSRVEVMNVGHLTAKKLQALARLPRLHSLTVWCDSADFDALSPLPQYPALKEFVISCHTLSDDHLTHLGACLKLEKLHILGAGLSGYGLETLARHPALTQLGLTNAPVATDAIQAISRATQLKSLELGYASIPPQSFHHLRTLVDLESFDWLRPK